MILNLYISQLQLQLNDTQSPVYRKLILDDIAKAELFMNNGIVDTEYFILFKDNDKDMDLVQKKIRNLISNLATCGLIASQTSNEDLRMIIDNFLNGGIKYESGTVIANEQLKKKLAPKGMTFNTADFIISDKYATILTVLSYPKYITPWLFI